MEPTVEGTLERHRLHGSKCRARGRSLDGIDQVFLQEPLSLRKGHRVKSQLLVFRIRERQAGVVALHHTSDVLRDGAQQFAELQVCNNLIVHVEEQPEAVVLTPQFLRRPPQSREIQSVIERQAMWSTTWDTNPISFGE